MRGLRALMIMSVGLMAVACSEGPPPPKAVGQATSAHLPSGNYGLGPGDKVRLIVFGEDNLSGEFSVSAAGSLAFPLIGEVPAKGRTIDQVKEDVVQRLGSHYVKDPRVSLEILTYRPYYILGEVNKPGEYPFEPDLTVLGAVASAEGFTYRANVRRIYIKHAGEGGEAVYTLTGDLEVRPGDVIRVGERHF
jgi:protein involved in polysaccharide export with SLBB domain